MLEVHQTAVKHRALEFGIYDHGRFPSFSLRDGN
jgi:hypothetical protein